MNKLEKYGNVLFSTLSEITSLIIAGNDKRVIFAKLLDCSLIVLQAERVFLLELDGEKIIRYSKNKSDMTRDSVKIEVLSETPVLRDWMIKEGQRGMRRDGGDEIAFGLPLLAQGYLDDGETNRVIISAPLVAKKSIFGLLVAIHRGSGGTYASEDEQLITALANQAAIALENHLLYKKLEKEAITDGLTGVYNYRFLIGSLEREIKRAMRFKQTFCFVMLDVDNLKAYNDSFGHLSGSEALKQVAAIIEANSREIDFVSKYGGDEFGLILPQTNLDGAVIVTRRIIQAVKKHRFDGKKAGVLTCSAGISNSPADGVSGRELIASADKALYQAKRSGKNQLFTTKDLVTDARK
jgi:diguanylate cyclase (GGDEF)-like protein